MRELQYMEEAKFVDLLVKSMTGYSAQELSETNKHIIESCWAVYQGFLEKYFLENYSQRDWMRLQSFAHYDDKQLAKDSELLEKYQHAHQAFLKMISVTYA